MSLNVKALATSAALIASLAAVSPASALVIVKDLSGGTGANGDTFGPAFPLGDIPAKFLYETASACKHVANGCTYDFVFSLAGMTAGDITSLQMEAQQSHKPVNISFDVFSGTPGTTASVANSSNPNWLGDSGVGASPVLPLSLGDGNYYVQVAASQVVVSGEASSGSLTVTLVPEPAAWSMMLLGVAALGAVVRRKRVALAA